MIGEESVKSWHYVAICLALVVLTIVTVGVSFLPLDPSWHVVIGLAIAALKASLVVLFFMHLWFSTPLTWVVAVVTGCWLSILVVLTLTDYLSRGLVPFMPGH